MANSNNKTIKRIFHFAVAVMVAAGMFLVPKNLVAQSGPAIILDHALELKCAGDDMKDEVKAHFRRSRNYGKMLAASSQIKGRANTIARRIKRDPCYSSLGRDLKKLDESTCKLNALYEEAMIRAARCQDKPIVGDTRHVARKIHAMMDASRCMVIASHGNHVVLDHRRHSSVSPIYDRTVQPRTPDWVTPGEWPVRQQDRHGHSVLSR